MKEKIILVGSGQQARVVLYNIEAEGKYEVVGIIDSDTKKKNQEFLGIKIIGDYFDIDKIKEEYGINKFFIAFGNMQYRKSTYEMFKDKGWKAVNIIHPNAVISKDAKLGEGILIECGCLVTPNPIIGNNVVINTGSQVNHDNIVEDHVYIASGVVLSGGVRIGSNTLLDDGVIVTLGRKVDKNCIIGAGAIVTKDIVENSVAYGNPAKIIRKNIQGGGYKKIKNLLPSV